MNFVFISGDELQKKWKNLRTCFKREYDAQKNVASGSGAKRRRKYIYFDQLLFLSDSFESRTTSNSMQHNDGYQTEDEHDEEMNVNTRADRMAKSSTRRTASKSYEESLLEILKEKKNEEKEIDEDKYFLLSLLPSFKKFNEDQKFVARSQIMNVMRHVRMSGNLPTTNVYTGNPIWTGANSTPSTSKWGNSFRQTETLPLRQDQWSSTHSARSAAQLFSTFQSEEEPNYFNEPPVEDENSELSSILTL